MKKYNMEVSFFFENSFGKCLKNTFLLEVGYARTRPGWDIRCVFIIVLDVEEGILGILSAELPDQAL